jgi:glycosyltransferase involved in cell wall biosynthesis
MPSAQLAEDWRSYTETYYLPNYMELDRYLEVIPQPHEDVIIGWGGSLSHVQSFVDSGVLTALKTVCKARPNVKVMICGDERVYQLLQVPANQKIFQPWVSYKEWPQQLAYYDIGIAPLCGAYDQRRSWIKIMEYMCMKIPWIASDGPAYHSLRSYGWLVQNKSNAWERILLDMVDNLAGHKMEALSDPFLFSLSQSIDQNVDKIIALYQSIQAKYVNTGVN